MAVTAYPWIGDTDDKLYLQSGNNATISATIKDSQASGKATPSGISWDGTDTPWSDVIAERLLLQSGQFSVTIKTSRGVVSAARSASWDGTDTPWCHQGDKLLVQSGQFSVTIKTSLAQPAFSLAAGLSYDGANSPWCNTNGDLKLQSGQFSGTIKTSRDLSGIDNASTGVSWDGTNTPWCGSEAGKLYLQSGQFSATLKTSRDISGIEASVTDIDTDDVNSRLDLKTLQALAAVGGAMVATLQTVRLLLEGYRWRNDDGSESAATFRQAQDTVDSVAKNTRIRLRVLLEALAGNPNADQHQLEYKETNDPDDTYRKIDV